MVDVQVELKEEKRKKNRTAKKLAAAAKRARGATSPKAAWDEGDYAESLLRQARFSHGNDVKLVLDAAKAKMPREKPVKKPRRLHWARKWAAEPEWEAPKERG